MIDPEEPRSGGSAYGALLAHVSEWKSWGGARVACESAKWRDGLCSVRAFLAIPSGGGSGVSMGA